MHELVERGLEDYLVGKVSRDIQVHLSQCAECRVEVGQFQEISGLFEGFKIEETLEPEPGLYYRVMKRIETEQPVSIWSIFSLDAAFGRKVAFASLMVLAVVGSFLVSTESAYPVLAPRGPEAVMASHDVSVPHDTSADRDRMLLTLASYDSGE